MGPDSPLLLIVLVTSAAALLVALARYRHIAVRIGCGVLALILAMTAGTAVVNDYYGYYQTWSQLAADWSGRYTALTATPAADRALSRIGNGQLRVIALPGSASGISRTGLIFLPPQYFQAQYARTRFPVVELLHGTPGSPSAWPVHLKIVSIMDQLIARRLIGPMVLVMPMMSAGHPFQECVNAPGALDDTYISQDVRADVQATYRVTTIAAEWGIAGYSSGGYCAANLALRHPADFGASAAMDGYFRPQDGPAAKALRFNPAAETANDPTLRAARLRTDSGPLPSFWLSVGTGNPGDVAGARAFAGALRGLEAVDLYQVSGAGHNVYAWEPAIPYMLQWMWTQLASPELRVQFPVSGLVRNSTISMPGSILPAARSGAGHAPGAPSSQRHAPRSKVPCLRQAGCAQARAGSG